LKKAGELLFVEHVSNDGYELIPLVGDGGGLIDYGYFFFSSDENDGRDLIGWRALFEITFGPKDPLGIDYGGGL